MKPEDTSNYSIAYGAKPLGLAEFEMKMVSFMYGLTWTGSLRVGLMIYNEHVPIGSGSGIPRESYNSQYHLVWDSQRLFNNLIAPEERSDYGYVDLDDLCEGDCVGLRLSQDGELEFTVNGT